MAGPKGTNRLVTPRPGSDPGGVPPEGDEPTGRTDESQWVAAGRRSTEYSTVSET